MDLKALHAASYVNWSVVSDSWARKTVGSRMLLFAARRYLEHAPAERPDAERAERLPGGLPEEVRRAYLAPPEPGEDLSGEWGRFVDAALAAEFEMVPYGERPPMISELRAGLSEAARLAGEETDLGRWFVARRAALPGSDLPDGAGYLPV